MPITIMVVVLIGTAGLSCISGCGLMGGGSSSEIKRIAPPEPAASPEEILPPRVISLVNPDWGDVTQVSLDLNPDARYQFGYDSGGSRVAILTVVEGSQYDAFVQSFDDAYEKALSDGDDATAPKYLDDVGDGAVVYETIAVFKSGDDCGIIFANIVQDVVGEQRATLTLEEIEQLVRIAAPRL